MEFEQSVKPKLPQARKGVGELEYYVTYLKQLAAPDLLALCKEKRVKLPKLPDPEFMLIQLMRWEMDAEWDAFNDNAKDGIYGSTDMPIANFKAEEEKHAAFMELVSGIIDVETASLAEKKKARRAASRRKKATLKKTKEEKQITRTQRSHFSFRKEPVGPWGTRKKTREQMKRKAKPSCMEELNQLCAFDTEVDAK